MPSFTGKTFSSFYKNILGIDQSSNTGADATTRNVQDGAGNNTVLSLSDDQLAVKPVNDDGAVLKVTNAAGNIILAVNTTDSIVRAGASQVAANTQYTHFGMAFNAVTAAAMSDDTHYAVPFNGMPFSADTIANYAMGTATTSSFNDTEPATSLTIATTAQSIIQTYWYVMDDITIDRVVWWQGADAATGSSTAAYLMGYNTVDATTASTGGDLSSGVKLASSSTVTNAGYEQAYYNQMSLSANVDVDAGKVILFTFCFDDTEATDYTINATVKFHIR